MQKYRPALHAIETRFGVPASVVLAIWGRETDYGRYTLPYDGLRVLATQAYVGRRKDQYRNEFILALKILGEGEVTRKDMRASWAGATGLDAIPAVGILQARRRFRRRRPRRHLAFGAGRARLRRPAARQQGLAERRALGLRGAAPANVDCTMGVPEVTKPIGEWLRAGFVPVRGQKLSAAEQAQPASLLQPEGIYGPAFLTTKNYFVIKEYNFSDLYVLFVGHLADRMTEPATVRDAMVGVDAVAHRRCRGDAAGLTRIGLYKDKLDGKAGMLTRAALGAYQKSAGLKVDCWPSEAVLRSISAAH